ncbi:hypothetical protein PPL_05023 [Heterostelium album PN500]|uniref:F-box domain-containing protein n=1 Tax=Heterostelium pallidum (strain ATCC 26659 / Pp 5 / PN500) TaxID=670386 RepID=D3B979_HETP5|nr:hypothetical protein PPL_05023 [Heterostelium album PN500]EFA82118.1 hypothetical protein PPL_05023 [Heterostelium album PN500]|eukprot:XP_020434235.1 hypothetical protein PPL_05023 [Heterostelium album PN500]
MDCDSNNNNNKVDYSNFNSLLNLSKIIAQFYGDADEKQRSASVKFFVDYHNSFKFKHYIDNRGYIKFILDVLFDSSLAVFNELAKLNCLLPKDLYDSLIKDKRFVSWFNALSVSDNAQLHHRIQILYDICPNISDTNFNFEKLQEIVQNDTGAAGVGNNAGDDKMSTESLAKSLPDILLEKIISKTVDFSKQRKRYALATNKVINSTEYSKELLNLALVSKHFLKVLSKYINKFHFEWHNYLDANSEYCLLKSPKFFDYNSIRYVPTDKGVEVASQALSGVETFYIKSDEPEMRREEVKRSVGPSMPEVYQAAISEDHYLVYPPPMPCLKQIIVKGYYGDHDAYSLLLSNIIENTLNDAQHGIEHFSLFITKDDTDEYADVDFLQPLVKLHSKTLKSITIHYNDMVTDDYGVLLATLKEILPTIVQHNYKVDINKNDYNSFLRNFKIYCYGEEDDQVYQYLEKQKNKYNLHS